MQSDALQPQVARGPWEVILNETASHFEVTGGKNEHGVLAILADCTCHTSSHPTYRIQAKTEQAYLEQGVNTQDLCMPGKAKLAQRKTRHLCKGVPGAGGPATNLIHSRKRECPEDGQQGAQLNLTANEMTWKQMRMERTLEGSQFFFSLSQALELDQIIPFPGNACNTFSELFADQPRQNLGPVMDLLVLSQGHQTNFLDIIHLKFTTSIQFE
ncbi:hypothetical protein P7K49_019168 [Saguinus oedipus]|uniref:Sorting nexin protein WASP-binding domain-containing protein n=1 Tax=Saguinus oedipus TaxID=9490 RepID=A0ABQ9UWV7_SAGOE|nr:hypothetical protein P7K49_019168 [Saguinus oedipus]